MADDISTLEGVLETKLENLYSQVPGSKEQHSATEDVKILGDLHNKELEIYLNDADRCIRREQDYEFKNKELDFKKEELEFKKEQFEHEKVTAKTNKIVNYIKVGIEGAGLGLSGLALWKGYQMEYKFNGITSGKTFSNLKSSLERIKKH